MARFWEVVNEVLGHADMLLLLLDARMVKETRNREIEDKVRKMGKPLIYVITKSDLVPRAELLKWKKRLNPCVFVSAKDRQGTSMLRERILIEAQKAGLKWRILRVGVLGYPNVGKSSLINALKGKKAAPVSSTSGYTRGVRNVRADTRIMLIDTPGVIPYREDDAIKHILTGTKDHTKVKEPDLAVMELMARFPGKIERFYGVRALKDKEKTLERIALKRNLLLKGGKPDVMRMAKTILQDWQKGRIS